MPMYIHHQKQTWQATVRIREVVATDVMIFMGQENIASGGYNVFTDPWIIVNMQSSWL